MTTVADLLKAAGEVETITPEDNNEVRQLLLSLQV